MASQIVVRGYGVFGGIEYLATLGYGSSEVTIVTPVRYHTLIGPNTSLYVLAGYEGPFVLAGYDGPFLLTD
jgi:hypothetical protein